jgi:hypothetical protein
MHIHAYIDIIQHALSDVKKAHPLRRCEGPPEAIFQFVSFFRKGLSCLPRRVGEPCRRRLVLSEAEGEVGGIRPPAPRPRGRFSRTRRGIETRDARRAPQRSRFSRFRPPQRSKRIVSFVFTHQRWPQPFIITPSLQAERVGVRSSSSPDTQIVILHKSEGSTWGRNILDIGSIGHW